MKSSSESALKISGAKGTCNPVRLEEIGRAKGVLGSIRADSQKGPKSKLSVVFCC